MKVLVFSCLANLRKYFFILEVGQMEILGKLTTKKQ